MGAWVAGSIALFAFLLQPALLAADRPSIERVLIRGTRRPLQLETRAGQPFDPERIDRDLRHLWNTGWFNDIRVESSESAGGLQLTFALVEKPRLYLRRVKFGPAREQRPVGVEKGVQLDPVLATQVAVELRRQLVEEGYADAKVKADIRPLAFQKADLHLRVERGRMYRVQKVRFAGSLGLREDELQEALLSTRPRRVLPGLGWRDLQPFSEQRLQSDVEWLRSLYFSRGYFDAQANIGRVDIRNGNATVTLAVDSGPHYEVGHLAVVGAGVVKEISPRPGGPWPANELCQCLLDAQREAEKRGEMNFSAKLQLRAMRAKDSDDEKPVYQREADQSRIAVTADLEHGPALRLGRIEFSGNHTISDATLRRVFLLREGDPFDQERLRRSVVRLNRLGLLDPVTLSDLRTELVPNEDRVNLTVRVREVRGRWSLSGPFGPVTLLRPPQFTVGIRLPSWGKGPAELSTYYATFSLGVFPVTGAVLLGLQMHWQPLVSLMRPYLPGHGWLSGIVLSPQLSRRQMLSSYGLTHILGAAGTALGRDDSLGPPDVSVPAWWRSADTDVNQANIPAAGLLRCEQPRPSWAWLRAAGSGTIALVANWLLTAALP